MTTTSATKQRAAYNRTIGIAAMQGRGFYYPWAAAIGADGRLYVLGRGLEGDPRGVRVTVMNLEEEYFGTFGAYGTGDGQFIWTSSIAMDSRQRIFISDEEQNRITIMSADGDFLAKWGVGGSGEGEMAGPTGLAFDLSDELLVVDHLNSRVQRFSAEGGYIGAFGAPGSGNGEFNLPWGICVDGQGDIYVADWGNDRIQRFTSAGQFVTVYGTPGRGDGQLHRPSGVCVDGDGFIYVTDWGNHRVQVLDPDGGFVQSIRGQATTSKWAQEFLDTNVEERDARAKANLEPDIEFIPNDPHEESAHIERYFWGPTSPVLDGDGHLYVVDSNRHRLQVFDV